MLLLYILTTLIDNQDAWNAHATIAKESVASQYYPSYKEFKAERYRYTISDEVIESLNYRLYNDDQNYYFGDYLFSEVEVNSMSYDSSLLYYKTTDTIPIPCSNQRLVNPEGFHSIKKREQKQKQEVVEKVEVVPLPERKSNEFCCSVCNLHFSSERQLQRHQRIHRTTQEVKEPSPSKFTLKVFDGELDLSKEEYDAVRFYLKDTEYMRKNTVQLYIPSLLQMWKEKQYLVSYNKQTIMQFRS